jgi:hypothetical protein
MSARVFINRVCVTALLTACVPEVDRPIESAPCPCPEGYYCCRGEQCVQNGTPCKGEDTGTGNATGTDTGEADTGCRENADCGGGEICISWADIDETVKGPRHCRTPCFSSDDCAEGQVCELTLSNGRPIDDYQLALACIDATGTDGCGDVGCRKYVDAPISSGDTDLAAVSDVGVSVTICEDNTVTGCFIAVDAECGLLCKTEEIAVCEEGGCRTTSEGATCGSGRAPPPEWCLSYPCADCLGVAVPGGTACADSQKQACLSLPLNDGICGDEGCECSEICLPLELIGECR